MARLPRVVIVDVAHHVTQRANGRQFILASDAGRMVYLDLLRRAAVLCCLEKGNIGGRRYTRESFAGHGQDARGTSGPASRRFWQRRMGSILRKPVKRGVPISPYPGISSPLRCAF